jgi:hypothetical protein
MCVVIDINTLASVFSTESEKHAEFSPVKKWVEEGRGFIVYGGSKYKAELAKTFRYLRLIRQMRDGGQAISIRDTAVDAFEEEVRKKTRVAKSAGVSSLPASQDTMRDPGESAAAESAAGGGSLVLAAALAKP